MLGRPGLFRYFLARHNDTFDTRPSALVLVWLAFVEQSLHVALLRKRGLLIEGVHETLHAKTVQTMQTTRDLPTSALPSALPTALPTALSTALPS